MKAVVTLSIKYSPSALTHPTLKAYADKIGADFVVLDKQEISVTPQWEKFRLHDLLNTYERIIYLDSDLIVRDDCPDLFEIVPKDKIGLFNEALFNDRIVQQKLYGLNKYYNSGVMVISRKHKSIFVKPETETNDFFEQTYLNTKFKTTEIFELNYKFNRMSCLDTILGVSRLDSYIVHYAGCPSISMMMELITKDLASWEKDKPKYEYTRRIHVNVSGGLGDQLCSQPAVRYLKKLLPDTEVSVSTHFPRIFRDEEGLNTFQQGSFVALPDTPYQLLNAFPNPDSVVFSVVSANMCNRVDYCSIALLNRILPVEDKRIRLAVSLEDLDKLIKVVGIRELDKLVLIHAGKHWDTKTFPKEYWEKIIDGLVEKKIPVCLIGKTGSPGVWEFERKEGVIDTVDLLDLDELIALIYSAKCLISNDSGPVHIAGAFDNEIVLIPTVNHPEHILPFREKRSYALYKYLLLDDYKTTPFLYSEKNLKEDTLDNLHYSWEKYLLEPSDIIKEVEKII